MKEYKNREDMVITDTNIYKLIDKIRSIPIGEWHDTCMGRDTAYMWWREVLEPNCEREQVQIEIVQKFDDVYTIILGIKEKCGTIIDHNWLNESQMLILRGIWDKYFELKEKRSSEQQRKKINEMIEKLLEADSK